MLEEEGEGLKKENTQKRVKYEKEGGVPGTQGCTIETIRIKEEYASC